MAYFYNGSMRCPVSGTNKQKKRKKETKKKKWKKKKKERKKIQSNLLGPWKSLPDNEFPDI